MPKNRLFHRRHALQLGLGLLTSIFASKLIQRLVSGHKAKALNDLNNNLLVSDTNVIEDNTLLAFNTNEIVGAQIDESKIQKIIHVDINHSEASDSNSGLRENPLKTFKAALKKAKGHLRKGEGTKIVIHPGVYREGELVIDGKSLGSASRDALLIIEGTEKGQVILSGSEIWQPDTWQMVQRGGMVYYQHDWPYDFGNNGGGWGKYGPKQVIAHRSEMVFINGQPLKQVLLEKYDYTWPNTFVGKGKHKYIGFDDPKDVLKPDTFGVAELDENGNKIYIRPQEGIDFSQAKIEIATKPFLLRLFHMENIVLRNLSFQHSNGVIGIPGAAVMFGPWYGENKFRGSNILIEDCDFRWNNGRGLSLIHCKNVTLRRNTANYNGVMGIVAFTLLNTVWEDNETSFNNWRGYKGDFVGWAIAGTKIHNTRNGLFRNHKSIGNMTIGLWFDIGNKNILIEGLIAIHNIRGLFLEISPGPILVRNSLLANDQEVNLLIISATNISLENSIIYAGKGGDAIQFVSSSRTFTDKVGEILGENNAEEIPILLGETQFRNNVIIAKGNDRALIFQKNGNPDNYREFLQQDYFGSHNLYWATQKRVFGIDFRKNKMTDIQGWSDFTEEKNYLWRKPSFVNPENYNFRLKNKSPLKNQESTLPIQKLNRLKVQELKNFLAWLEEDILLSSLI